ncbi:MAG: valine--tRNA ligase [Verrucomicrobia bacterium]|nr:valine--tRNA ligase [Verrucomicrobiota bacterium]MCH8510729.1 valine--tRNA ligase [Kiritimatiellia bacterium]
MEKNYDPTPVEEKWYAAWEAAGCFAGDPEAEGEPYSIVIPPPNVTGRLHIGHALNNSIQDILIRWKRMQGFNAVWIPGTDHAGIATQSVVERQLREEGTTRREMGREAFVKRVWEWKEEYGGTIIRQLRKMGCSCDWERERFTMDEGLSEAVKEVFIRLYEQELIYQGDYIINWSPALQTALSDDEVEHEEVNGKLYHIRYPVEGGSEDEHIIVATTRPETLMGDVAVAVNPRDPRYKDLPGKKIILPVIGRELKVIQDDFVDPEFGTGIVKVTPAHDPNDFEMGQRHNLTPINVMHPDGTMNEAAGPYEGMDRFDCRKQLVADLEAKGLLMKIENHVHKVGHCYRSGCVIEPRLSRQWFVKMKPLARKAIQAVKDGDLEFVPERWNKVYLNWLDNIRDWCISRQLWWGHRIPIYYADSTGEVWAARETPTVSPKGATDIRQDEDVLDTWFSSWLWPFSVHGWPEKTPALDTWYPSSTLATAPDIIFFWVARMVMAGYAFMDDVPFKTVYLHGVVRDKEGRKQSKSLGNSIDPLEIIREFSADALRFSLITLNATGQDVRIGENDFEMGRNYSTKIWNAARFLEMQGASEGEIVPECLGSDDRHLLLRLHQTIREATEHLDRFRFNDYSHTLYAFIWHDYCDWYVEYAKGPLNGDDEVRKRHTLAVMHFAFRSALKLLHPLMPFITEELWEAMGYREEDAFLMKSAWPKPIDPKTRDAWGLKNDLIPFVEAKRDLIRAARQLRADYNLKPSQEIDFIVRPASAALGKGLKAEIESVNRLVRGNVTLDANYKPEGAAPGLVSKAGYVFMPADGLIDVDAEKQRIGKQLKEVEGHINRGNARLNNEAFISKAPEEVIAQQREQQDGLIEKAEKLRALLKSLTTDAKE